MAIIIGFLINGGNLLHLETTVTERQTEWKGGGKKGEGRKKWHTERKKHRRLEHKLIMLQCHINLVNKTDKIIIW